MLQRTQECINSFKLVFQISSYIFPEVEGLRKKKELMGTDICLVFALEIYFEIQECKSLVVSLLDVSNPREMLVIGTN